jgi:hypothetical protein
MRRPRRRDSAARARCRRQRQGSWLFGPGPQPLDARESIQTCTASCKAEAVSMRPAWAHGDTWRCRAMPGPARAAPLLHTCYWPRCRATGEARMCFATVARKRQSRCVLSWVNTGAQCHESVKARRRQPGIVEGSKNWDADSRLRRGRRRTLIALAERCGSIRSRYLRPGCRRRWAPATRCVLADATRGKRARAVLRAACCAQQHGAPPQWARRVGGGQAAGLLRDQTRLCVPSSSSSRRA